MKYVIDLPDSLKLQTNRAFEYSDDGICLCVFDPKRIERYEGRDSAIKVGNIILYDEDIAAVILDVECEDEITIFNENGCVDVVSPDDIDIVIGTTDVVHNLIEILRGYTYAD